MLVVVVSESVLLLPLPAVVVVVALVPFVHAGMSMTDGLREGLGLLGAAAFAAVVTTLLVREQEARGELARAHGQLQEYAVQAERLATVQERNRVARDIHDGLGHALTVVQMQIKAARAVLEADPARADGVLAKAQDQAEEALAEVRRSVGALRERQPAVPLPDALRALADEASAAGVPTGVDVAGAAAAARRRGRGGAVPGRAGGADQRPQARPGHPGRGGAGLLAPGRRAPRGARRRRPAPAPTVPRRLRPGRAYANARRCWAAG